MAAAKATQERAKRRQGYDAKKESPKQALAWTAQISTRS
jgi:hypothetical protein